jgi:hypothetical protein
LQIVYCYSTNRKRSLKCGLARQECGAGSRLPDRRPSVQSGTLPPGCQYLPSGCRAAAGVGGGGRPSGRPSVRPSGRPTGRPLNHFPCICQVLWAAVRRRAAARAADRAAASAERRPLGHCYRRLLQGSYFPLQRTLVATLRSTRNPRAARYESTRRANSSSCGHAAC